MRRGLRNELVLQMVGAMFLGGRELREAKGIVDRRDVVVVVRISRHDERC